MKKSLIKKMTVRAILTLVWGLTCTFAATAQQTNNYVREVQSQLGRVESWFKTRGLERTHNFGIDRLAQNEKAVYTFNLKKGWQYALVGVCDGDCADIDVTVYDEYDNRIARDNGSDDKPLTVITPRWTGNFRVEVHMYKCRSNHCYYGIGIFGR
jgi:hypothetical protein